MGLFSKDIKTMEDMFLHGLQDIYYAEQQITKALPTMIEQATNRDLAAGLRAHLDETHKQIERLDLVGGLGHQAHRVDQQDIGRRHGVFGQRDHLEPR